MSSDGWHELMKRGCFEQAWRICDRTVRSPWRLRRPDQPRHLQDIWNGTPLEGRRVLIRCYHGLGDTLQFIRYLPAVVRVARETSVWVQPTLMDLLRPTAGAARLIPLHDGQPEAEYDVDVEIMELPHVFRTTLATIPASVPYIRVPADPAAGGFVVGLAWRSGDWDVERNVPFPLLRHLLAQAGVRFVPLQARLTPEETTHWRDAALCTTVLSLARQLASCSLVISVDTMAAHLAGALGVPTWTLLRAEADWRWLTNRSDTPWYPTMRLYRQSEPGRWEPVLDRVNRDLAVLRAGSSIQRRIRERRARVSPVR